MNNIKTGDFDYKLPETKIARYPLPKRDDSKLLVWNRGKINHSKFKNIARFIPEKSLLVFNNTRVIHARIIFRKETGAKIEIFCLEPVNPSDYQIAFQQTKRVTWKCMVGNAKKWKSGSLTKIININNQVITLEARQILQQDNSFQIIFNWNGGFHFSRIIEKTGILPIPPYLRRDTEESDENNYQTIYAKKDGSVAAPTAGLHFTETIFNQLSDKNIQTREITLHVGAGTFQPIKSETITGHSMHHEQVIIPKTFIEELLNFKGKLIAVGTTSVRSLESLYWLGLKLNNNKNIHPAPEILQWEPYKNQSDINVKKALTNILDYLDETHQDELNFSTQIIIVPGYSFKVINGMITNFHMPRSTLLLLISAFLGENWKDVYQFALENNFRFLSYGDGNLYLF